VGGATDLTKKSKFSMTLKSMNFHRIEAVDTIFRFILSIDLIKENGERITASDTIYGDKKQEILDEIQGKKFSVNINKINKTRLLDISIESFVLTNPSKYAIFSAGSIYSTYLIDRN
jgi:hypothetical protein